MSLAGGATRRRLGQAFSLAHRLPRTSGVRVAVRGYAASAAAPLAEQARQLLARCGGRAGLQGSLGEAAEIHRQAVKLGAETVVKELSFQDLGALCRLLTASGHLLDGKLLEAAAAALTKLAGSGGLTSPGDADAAAALALAACESGAEQGLGAELVDSLRTAGVASGKDGPLGARGAAALALAAACTGRADVALLDALLGRCSSCELDFGGSAGAAALLGDLRLAALLAGPGVAGALDIRAAGFARTLCGEVPLDDPRGPLPEAGGLREALTPFEDEVSSTLTELEVVHSRGALAVGAFLPLTSGAQRTAVFAEDAMSHAVYVNAASRRTAWQRWKYRAVAAGGWRVAVVEEEAWRSLREAEERKAHLRQVLQNPPDVAEL